MFRNTGSAHHEAFIEAGGEHPGWPLWHADSVQEQLREFLDAEFTKSQLAYLLITASTRHQVKAPGVDWVWYQARFFTRRYREVSERERSQR